MTVRPSRTTNTFTTAMSTPNGTAKRRTHSTRRPTPAANAPPTATPRTDASTSGCSNASAAVTSTSDHSAATLARAACRGLARR
jgi:hypothetical protein